MLIIIKAFNLISNTKIIQFKIAGHQDRHMNSPKVDYFKKKFYA